MLILLPPSETKRDGGDGEPLRLEALAYPKLNSKRRTLLRALKALSKNPVEMSAALKLGPKQASEIERNRKLASAPTMAAIDRYTGVLYDALDAATLSSEAREAAGGSLVIASALFGLTGALDEVPAYRFSHDSRLPGIPLGAHWRDAVAAQLKHSQGLILDLRSEAYGALGPAPDHAQYLKVLTLESDGSTRALNHFNKKAKGDFTRALLLSGHDFATAEELIEWAQSQEIALRRSLTGGLELLV